MLLMRTKTLNVGPVTGAGAVFAPSGVGGVMLTMGRASAPPV